MIRLPFLRTRRTRFPTSRTVALAACLAALASAASGQPEAPEPIELSLRQALVTALERNLGYRIQRVEPEIAESEVLQQEAAFDPSLFARGSLNESELQWRDADGDLRQTLSDNRNYSAGVSKRIVTGGQVSASASLSRSDGSSFNPELNQLVGGGLSERASLGVEILQPLLRDFGREVNLAPTRLAESRARVADLQTRNAVLDLLQQTEVAYWRLADAYQRRQLRESSIELGNTLLEEAREREGLGLATALEVLQAEANLAQRKEEIIRAEQAIREAADDLFVAMGLLDETLALDAQPEVAQLPTVDPSLPEFEVFLASAFAHNFDPHIQEEILDQLEQERILARNEMKPAVDVSLAAGYNGLSPIDARDAFEEAVDRRGEDWGLSLNFSLPWGARAAKAGMRQTLLRIDQAETRLAEVKQDLILSARSAWRVLYASLEQVRAAEVVVELQTGTFEQERSKYQEGLSSLRFALETQRDLDAAKLSLLDARLRAVEAKIQLARVEGALLARHGLEWNDAAIFSPIPERE